ncbi:MAG TPA: hypothetical protein VM866_05990 [Pyrinomonadaceae bacterium]|nr:hypothetical protein [Pyrinomonadaceae bacterium]
MPDAPVRNKHRPQSEIQMRRAAQPRQRAGQQRAWEATPIRPPRLPIGEEQKC